MVVVIRSGSVSGVAVTGTDQALQKLLSHFFVVGWGFFLLALLFLAFLAPPLPLTSRGSIDFFGLRGCASGSGLGSGR